MYNRELIDDLVGTIEQFHGIADKAALATRIQRQYNLVKDRSVYYCKWFAINSWMIAFRIKIAFYRKNGAHCKACTPGWWFAPHREVDAPHTVAGLHPFCTPGEAKMHPTQK